MQRLQGLVPDNTIHMLVFLVYIYNARYVQLRGGRFLDRAALLVLCVQAVGEPEIVLCGKKHGVRLANKTLLWFPAVHHSPFVQPFLSNFFLFMLPLDFHFQGLKILISVESLVPFPVCADDAGLFDVVGFT